MDNTSIFRSLNNSVPDIVPSTTGTFSRKSHIIHLGLGGLVGFALRRIAMKEKEGER